MNLQNTGCRVQIVIRNREESLTRNGTPSALAKLVVVVYFSVG